METLTLEQARKMALLSQALPVAKWQGSAYQKTVQVIDTLGYVQIDTISVVQRAHHHTLWSRHHGYQPEHLERMVREKAVFEYWSHAASYLTMRDFRFSLPRKHAIKSDKQGHWFKKDLKLMAYVLDKIRAEGPLMAKDFESSVIKKTGWESKPTKQALEMLYMQGDLMIAERRNFHKVYDLTERVLPASVETRIPTATEHAHFLLLNTLNTHGIAKLSEMVYLLKDVKVNVQRVIEQMLEQGELIPVSIGQHRYYTQPSRLAGLNQRINRRLARILSPFDNLIIQRDRLRNLFQFEYLLECYVPAAKRQYGYFVLPILWDGRLVARADCKAHRNSGWLEVHKLYLEPRLKQRDAFEAALDQELSAFAQFNGCERYTRHT
ncbi:winged helix-turn-helix domain-containing protein [Vibrio sp. SM6]|uniref:Winged helix-turn-helix domain-containing protein n=1 Tax=Vibrio agarilyticus TaxID=2726741 RepID=A0A7X8YFJ3_9VIBR|nr:crosslink repair DNA glycosylase YcaQ family protein [Vibrio agarilyticus]NLS11724.1 winged helix-turn-helix domain-containing protein [Vibrio agarilyticus]